WSAAYTQLIRSSTGSTIGFSNEKQFAEYLPIIGHRLALNPYTPFLMDAYLPRGYGTVRPYRLAVCDLYEQLHRTDLPYSYVYIEMKSEPPITCSTLDADREFGTVLAETSDYTMIALTKDY